jgi:hypothetical protein
VTTVTKTLTVFRLGEMIKAQKDDAGLNKGGRPKTSTPEEQVLKTTPTLEDVGISRKLSSRAQAIASIPAPEFEEAIADHRHERVPIVVCLFLRYMRKETPITCPRS